MEIRNCSATALVSQPLLALHYSIPHTAYVPATATGDAFTSALNVRTASIHPPLSLRYFLMKPGPTLVRFRGLLIHW